METLDRAVINRHDARLEESAKRHALVEQVADRLAELAGRRFVGLMGLGPRYSSSKTGLLCVWRAASFSSGSRSRILSSMS